MLRKENDYYFLRKLSAISGQSENAHVTIRLNRRETALQLSGRLQRMVGLTCHFECRRFTDVTTSDAATRDSARAYGPISAHA